MLTNIQIDFLNRVCSDKWTETNGVVNVNGHVNISKMNLTQIPVQFGRVDGDFNCRINNLKTLLGCPYVVCGIFNCDRNQLTSLEYGPKEINKYYACESNLLTTLIGAPEICNESFFCENNQLTSLEGCPRIIKYDLYCRDNPDLKYLWGIGRVGGISYNVNEINNWIITCSRKNIIFPFCTLEENVNWIKMTGQYSCLLKAPKEILQQFSPKILHLVDSGIC